MTKHILTKADIYYMDVILPKLSQQIRRKEKLNKIINNINGIKAKDRD